MTEFNWRQLDIRLTAVLASLVISGIIALFPYAHTPNNDAYTYIRTADIFLNQGLGAAFQHYTWASYAVLIALTSKIGLSLFGAAHLINALFYALIVFSFISIVMEMHSSRLIQFLAAVVILLYPQLNEYRAYVIRDIGFWALTLFSLWLFLVYARTGLLQYAVSFCAVLLFAITMRPEALLYLLVTPFALLLDHRFDKQECKRRFLTLACMVAGVGLMVLSVLTLSGVNVITLLTEFVVRYQPFLVNTFNPDPAQANAIGLVLFGDFAASYSEEYIGIFMAAGLLSILAANLFNGIGGPYFWVLVYGTVQKQLRVARAVWVPLLFVMATNAVVLFAFLFITRYLTSRYAILFSLMLALLVPQIIAYYLENKTGSGRRTAIVMTTIFLTYCWFDSYISFGDSKSHVYDAIEWLEENSDANTALVTNNRAVAYFSGKVEDYDDLLRSLTAEDILQSAPGDLVVLELDYPVTQMLSTPAMTAALEPVLALPSADDERIVILRRTNTP